MASSSRNRNDLENNGNGDDDFGDFGGFEAAEPVVDVPTVQAQPAESPWVMFSAGNASGRPDLLCAQNRFPTYLDPSDISGASGETVAHGINNSIPIPPQEDLFPEIVTENVLDGTLLAAAGPSFHPNLGLANGHLPDIGLGINESRMFSPPEVGPVQVPADEEPRLPNVQLLEEVNLMLADDESREQNVEHPVQVHAEVPVANRLVQQNANNEDNLTNVLLQQITSLEEKNKSLEEELSRFQEQMAAQRSRLDEAQSHFSEEVENIRKAGHDAISVVVEQYKEQSRTIILEQQEIAQRNLVSGLNSQMKQFQEMLQLERELNERKRETDRQEFSHRMEVSLQESRQRQQECFDSFLIKEEEKQRDVIARSIEEKSQESVKNLQEIINVELEKLKSSIEEIKMDYSKKLIEEKRNHEASLETAIEEQHKMAKEQMSQLVVEERERGRATLRDALEELKSDFQTYLQEQRQSDSMVRQRHLMSLDLFMESSRQQIALMMQCEKSLPPAKEDSKNNENS